MSESHLGGFICADWELRVTARCLRDDLGVRDEDPEFADIMGHEIIKAFVKDRLDRSTDTRQVSPLTCNKEIWVLARGNDHRGGTWFDEPNRVVWLVAYRLHRSGESDDFFPYCRELDAAKAWLPKQEDYKRLIVDRGLRFAFGVRIEAPLILREARDDKTEQRHTLGGLHGATIAIEVAEDLEATTIAFKVATLPYEYLALILTAFHADSDWAQTDAMPSRAVMS